MNPPREGMQTDDNYIRNTLRTLVGINSINPDLVPGAPGEGDIARFIAAELSDMGVEPDLTEIAPRRFNVTAKLTGTGTGNSLLFNAHMDTVGVDGMADPFSAREDNGRIYGRGAVDMKGGIAAILGAVKVLRDKAITLGGDLYLAFVADEEYLSIGTEAVVGDIRADAAIVVEPSGLAVCTAHKGFGLFEIETTGVAAHGGGYQGGVDANTHMARIAVELEKLQNRLRSESSHQLLGSATIHVPLISGGAQLFMYSPRCVMHVERRTLPGETREAVEREIKDIVADLTVRDPTLNAKTTLSLWRDAFGTSEDAPIVRAVGKGLEHVLGTAPTYVGHHWWEDSALFAEAGMDTVVIGPVGEGLHAKVEWCDLQSVVDLAAILALTARDYCGADGGNIP